MRIAFVVVVLALGCGSVSAVRSDADADSASKAGAGGGGHAGGGTSGAAGGGGVGDTAGATGAGGSIVTGAAGSTGSGGSAGTGGHGGASGAAGTTAGGGTTGTGSGGTTTTTCIAGGSTSPAHALITDFSDATSDGTGNYSFGSTSGDPGGTALFASGTKGTLSLSGGALTFTATVPEPTAGVMYPFSGFVLFLDGPACVNATSYTGVKFTISALTGACTVVFSFNDSEHTMASDDPNRGTCPATATCYGSQFAVTAATSMVPFGATPSNAGQPTATVDAGKLMGVEWQFEPMSGSTTGCTGSITVDNISFY